MKLNYDLNIPYDCSVKDLARYIDLGYSRVALNLSIDVSEFNVESNEKIKKSKQQKSDIRSKLLEKLKQPKKVTELLNYALTLQKNVKIFTRITLKAAECAKLTNFIREFQTLINNFDIIACESHSAEVTTYASEIMVVDIITFDVSSSTPQLSHKIVAKCLKRGVALEVDLGLAVASVPGRSITAKFINDLTLIRCPAILTVTSGAKNLWLIRSFLGLASILLSMGWPEKYLASLSTNCEMIVEHGLARKYTVQGSAAIVELNKLPGVKSVTVSKVVVEEDEDTKETSPKKKKIKLSE